MLKIINQIKEKIKKISRSDLVLTLVALIVFLSVLSLFTAFNQLGNQGLSSVLAENNKGQAGLEGMSKEFIPLRDWALSEPDIKAKAATIFDIEAGNFIYQKNIETELPIASLTKIMTAIIILEKLPLDQNVVITAEDVATEGEGGDLVVGETMTVRNLLSAMLIESSNDAAVALGRVISSDFPSLMNAKARELNLSKTYFAEPTGLSQWNYSTASDLAKLVKYSLKFPLLWDILKIKATEIYSTDKTVKHELFSTNKLLENIVDLVGGKTGFTEEAGGCLMTLIKINGQEGHYFTTIVLGSKNRELESKKLIEWAQQAFTW